MTSPNPQVPPPDLDSKPLPKVVEFEKGADRSGTRAPNFPAPYRKS